MIDDAGEMPLYQRVAADLRRRIADGRYPPGVPLPSLVDLMAEYGVARNTARDAIRLLAREGLVVVAHGRATRVRETQVMEDVPLPVGYAVRARHSTAADRAEWGVDPAVLMLQLVERETGLHGPAYPADRFQVVGGVSEGGHDGVSLTP